MVMTVKGKRGEGERLPACKANLTTIYEVTV
jgi:hypothetical protein